MECVCNPGPKAGRWRKGSWVGLDLSALREHIFPGQARARQLRAWRLGAEGRGEAVCVVRAHFLAPGPHLLVASSQSRKGEGALQDSFHVSRNAIPEGPELLWIPSPEGLSGSTKALRGHRHLVPDKWGILGGILTLTKGKGKGILGKRISVE